MKKAGVLFFILILQLWAIPSLAWYHRTHAYAAKIAVELLREKLDNPLYEELFSPNFLVELGRGAWREDYDPPIAGNERAQRHYYDPDSTCKKKGVKYYSYFVAWRLLGAPVTPLGPGECFEGAMRWALDGENIPENPFNWKDTILAYGGGTIESKKEAYFRLGHVLHLLMDVSDPDHAWNDPHPGSGKYFPDTVEGIAGMPINLLDEWMKGQPLITRDLREKVTLVMDLMRYGIKSKLKEKYGPDLERRYGKDIRLTGFEGILEDSIDPGLVEEFFLGQEKRNIGNRFPTLRTPSIKGTDILKFENFQAYFDELARFAKRKQGESGLSRFLGLLNLSYFLLDRASGEVRDIPWLSSSLQLMKLFQEPIYVIPAVNEYNQRETKPHYDLGALLLKKSTEFGAGLLRDFHDIVNEPPFVTTVRINQVISEDEKPEQIRSWFERTSKEKTGRTKEMFDVAEYLGFPKEYDVVESRDLSGDPDIFESGKSARISITFGPQVGQITEKIDPSSVHVFIAGNEIQGQMTDDHKWAGEFVVPDPSGDLSEETFQIEISARDLHAHYPRTHEGLALPEKGYELDADPATPARASPLLPYTWEGYTPGLDKNHKIYVRRGEEEAEEEYVLLYTQIFDLTKAPSLKNLVTSLDRKKLKLIGLSEESIDPYVTDEKVQDTWFLNVIHKVGYENDWDRLYGTIELLTLSKAREKMELDKIRDNALLDAYLKLEIIEGGYFSGEGFLELAQEAYESIRELKINELSKIENLETKIYSEALKKTCDKLKVGSKFKKLGNINFQTPFPEGDYALFAVINMDCSKRYK